MTNYGNCARDVLSYTQSMSNVISINGFHSIKKTNIPVSPVTSRGIVKAQSAEPLMSYDDVRRVMDYFVQEKSYRNLAFFVTGLATGLRVIDICKIKMTDVFDCIYDMQRGAFVLTFKDVLDIVEQKTKKHTVSTVDEMLITEAMRIAITQYLQSVGAEVVNNNTEPCIIIHNHLSVDCYLFASRKGRGTTPLAEAQCYRFITDAIKNSGVQIHAGTHTMRKTFLNIANSIACTSNVIGSNGTAMADCQILARHSNLSTTMNYMNATKARITSLRRAVSDFILGRTKVKSLKVEYLWDVVDE